MRRIFGQYSVYSTHPTDTVTNRLDLPFTLRRRQFPIRPAFAMTINKVQGQKLQRSGVLLDELNSFYPRTDVRRVVALWGSQQHHIFCTEWSDCKRRLHRSVVMLMCVGCAAHFCRILYLQSSVVNELPVAALYDVQR